MQVSNRVQQDPSRAANSSSAKQQLFRILRNRTPHYRVRKGLPLVPVPYLGQTNPVYGLPYYFLRYTLILSSHLDNVFQVVYFLPNSQQYSVCISLHDVPQSKPGVPLGNMSIFMIRSCYVPIPNVN
jgi:hypothetical protein